MSDEMICLSKLWVLKSEIIAIEFDNILEPRCDGVFITMIYTKDTLFCLSNRNPSYEEDVQKLKFSFR